MKRFFFLAIVFSILSFGSISSVNAQQVSGENTGEFSSQHVNACLERASQVLEISFTEAETMYYEGEIILVDQGDDSTAIKSTSGGNTIAILENTF